MIFYQNDRIRNHFDENYLIHYEANRYFVWFLLIFYSKQHFDQAGLKRMIVHLM